MRLASGILVGILLSLCTLAFAAEVRQFVLSVAPYPIFVNGVEYKDNERPILNYEGSTYVPLAKLGDITGVNYLWNAQLQRVEIITGVDGPVGTMRHFAEYAQQPPEEWARTTLQPSTEFVVIEEELGNPDSDLVLPDHGKVPGRPTWAEGWRSEEELVRKYYLVKYPSGDGTIVYEQGVGLGRTVMTLTFPPGWETATEAAVSLDGVRIRRYDGENYFYLSDVEKKLEQWQTP